MGLSKRTNQRGAEILADAFKVSLIRLSIYLSICSCGSVVEHCVSSAKVVGSIPREHTFTLAFMHLADAFIQSDLQLHSGYTFFISICVPWESNPQRFALLMQCSTTEPQEHVHIQNMYNLNAL